MWKMRGKRKRKLTKNGGEVIEVGKVDYYHSYWWKMGCLKRRSLCLRWAWHQTLT